jgi:hypothetical protein
LLVGQILALFSLLAPGGTGASAPSVLIAFMKGSTSMRTIKTTSGHEIALDGDLLAVLEALFREVTAKRELERSYEDLTREITHLIGQMTPEEVGSYFAESLFLNQVKYENDKLESYMRKLEKK